MPREPAKKGVYLLYRTYNTPSQKKRKRKENCSLPNKKSFRRFPNAGKAEEEEQNSLSNVEASATGGQKQISFIFNFPSPQK